MYQPYNGQDPYDAMARIGMVGGDVSLCAGTVQAFAVRNFLVSLSSTLA